MYYTYSDNEMKYSIDFHGSGHSSMDKALKWNILNLAGPENTEDSCGWSKTAPGQVSCPISREYKTVYFQGIAFT